MSIRNEMNITSMIPKILIRSFILNYTFLTQAYAFKEACKTKVEASKNTLY